MPEVFLQTESAFFANTDRHDLGHKGWKCSFFTDDFSNNETRNGGAVGITIILPWFCIFQNNISMVVSLSGGKFALITCTNGFVLKPSSLRRFLKNGRSERVTQVLGKEICIKGFISS